MTVQLAILGASEGQSNRYRVRMLIGDGVYNGELYPWADIKAAAPTMRGRPVNVDHSTSVLDIVGNVVDAFANEAVRALDGVIELNPKSVHYAATKNVIDAALAAGASPNLSIEADAPRTREIIDGHERVVRRVQRFTALGIVRKGACSDHAGCGIAARLSLQGGMSIPDEATTTTTQVVTQTTEKVALCAQEATIAALKGERDQLATKLALKETECAGLITRAEKAEGEAAKLKEDAERAPLVAELAVEAPGFKADGKSAVELRAALDAAKAVKLNATPVPAGRRTQLAAQGSATEQEARVAALRAKMGLSK